MAKSYVYIVTRNDLTHEGGIQGHTVLVSAHASLESANAAVQNHLESEMTEGSPGDEDDVDEPETEDGGHNGTVVVSTSKRHQSTAKVTKMELNDAHVTSSQKGASKLSASGKKRKAKGADDEEDENGEEAADEEKKPSKSTKGASKKKKNEEPPKDEPPKPPVARGTPDCLSGLQFVISGVLEGFTRDEAKALVVNRGGKTVGSISRNVQYVILGVNPGAKKLEKIEELGIPTLDFEAFNNLIRERSDQ